MKIEQTNLKDTVANDIRGLKEEYQTNEAAQQLIEKVAINIEYLESYVGTKKGIQFFVTKAVSDVVNSYDYLDDGHFVKNTKRQTYMDVTEFKEKVLKRYIEHEEVLGVNTYVRGNKMTPVKLQHAADKNQTKIHIYDDDEPLILTSPSYRPQPVTKISLKRYKASGKTKYYLAPGNTIGNAQAQYKILFNMLKRFTGWTMVKPDATNLKMHRDGAMTMGTKKGKDLQIYEMEDWVVSNLVYNFNLTAQSFININTKLAAMGKDNPWDIIVMMDELQYKAGE